MPNDPNLGHRVLCLEEDLDEQRQVTAKLTIAVNRLTDALENGQLAIRILFYIIGTVGALASTITWALGHITFTKGS